MEANNNKGWIIGVSAAFAASLCCIIPILAFLGGISGLASSFSWIEPYRPYLVGATILIFGFAWYQKLYPGKQIDCDCETDTQKSVWQTKGFLSIITIIAVLLMAFPYYSRMFYPKPKQSKIIVVDRNNIQTVQFNISGMDCEGCTAHINSELSKLNGIIEAYISYKNANAVLKFDKSKLSIDSITSAVNNIGYKIT